MKTQIEWNWALPSVDKNIVRSIEEGLGITFPNDYVECAMVNHGGRPSLHCIDFGGRKDRVFQGLLALTEGRKKMTVLGTLTAVADRLPRGLIPFGEDPAGNLYCFDYRARSHPTVVFWDHERSVSNPTNCVISVADSFTDMLVMLHECSD
jgi:hypothetical protein